MVREYHIEWSNISIGALKTKEKEKKKDNPYKLNKAMALPLSDNIYTKVLKTTVTYRHNLGSGPYGTNIAGTQMSISSCKCFIEG